MTEYWKRIKSILDIKGKSWTWLANQIHTDQSNLSKKIKVGSYPDADTQNNICGLLGITSDFLFKEVDDNFSPDFIEFKPDFVDIYAQLPSLTAQQADAVRALLNGFKNSSLLTH